MANSSASSGISLTTAVGVVFIILKLFHLIDWSWWWVLSPFCISIALYLAVLIITFVLWYLAKSVEQYEKKKFLKKYHKDSFANRMQEMMDQQKLKKP